MTTTRVDVDGLPVEVDSEEYAADPEWIVRQTRKERAELGLGDDVPEADDYNTQVGDDG